MKKLKEAGRLEKYMIYTHNKLELMVKKGNPKNIRSVKDLARDNLRQSHPNPLTEGIFKFYGSEMLNDLGIYAKVTGGSQCKGCWAVPNQTWFTERHHRETPHRIENDMSDVGIVWATEVAYGIAQGRGIEGVAIEAPYNKQDKVAYAIGPLLNIRNRNNAARFLAYLAGDDAQRIYVKYGFIRAAKDELVMR
jgi:ABC-type molybdate transport system substrate-binding protein